MEPYRSPRPEIPLTPTSPATRAARDHMQNHVTKQPFIPCVTPTLPPPSPFGPPPKNRLHPCQHKPAVISEQGIGVEVGAQVVRLAGEFDEGVEWLGGYGQWARKSWGRRAAKKPFKPTMPAPF